MRALLLVTVLLLTSCNRAAVVPPDGGLTADSQPVDAPSTDRGSPPPKGCAALAPFASGRQISTLYARKVRFAPSLSRLALVMHRDNAHGDLHIVTLPALGARFVSSGIQEAHWLPDESALLVTAPAAHGLSAATLAARSLTSGSTRVLAKDLFPFHMTSMAFHAWALGDRGRYVADVRAGTYPAMGLATQPLAGGKPRVLAARLYGAAYVASRHTTDLAWIQTNQAGDTMELNHGTVTGSKRVQVLVSKKQPLSSLSLLPGGRGVLVVQRAGTVNKLHLGAATGGSRVLGQWKNGYLTSSFPANGPPVAGYEVDPLGCAVVYNQDLPGVARGTHLRQIFSTP